MEKMGTTSSVRGRAMDGREMDGDDRRPLFAGSGQTKCEMIHMTQMIHTT